MKNLDAMEIWFVTGSQHLYGEAALREVAANSKKIVASLMESRTLPLSLVFKPVLAGPEDIRKLCLEANASRECAGLMLWMHTFSPAKMWIGGLTALHKPFLHFHTQFNRDLPWSEIDMDFMNLNQAAHGDREAGHLHTRLGLSRKIVVGHWTDSEVHDRIGSWMRAVRGWQDLQGAKFVRFADNMRNVAVTDGDKVAAEAKFGFSVNTHAVGDLLSHINEAAESAISQLCDFYEDRYAVAKDLMSGGARHESLRYAARLELGLRSFLEMGKYKGFTTNFEDLHGLRQLPGLAVQRLMAEGYGFGAEGDWKTCALLRAMKAMSSDVKAGTSFMEDYTYHLSPDRPLVLGAHMLEVCESIAEEGRLSLEIHPLSIGGLGDPVRLVFNARAGRALCGALVDLGHRFRMVASVIDVKPPPEPLPRLPVARAVWSCRPDFKTACAAWILAGGGHHTSFSQAVTRETLEDFAEIANVELAVIDTETHLSNFKQQLRMNEVYFQSPAAMRGFH